MRPVWIVGVVVGIIIMYLGIFGLEGFGLQLGWAGNTYTDNFNSLDTAFWTDIHYVPGTNIYYPNLPGGVTVSAAGTLKVTFTTGASQALSFCSNIPSERVGTPQGYDFSAGGSVEFQIIGPTVSGQCDYVGIGLTTPKGLQGGYGLSKVQSTGIWQALRPGDPPVFATGTISKNLQGSVALRISGSVVSYLVDGSQVAQASLTTTTMLCPMLAFASSPNNYGLIEIDNFVMTLGAAPPPQQYGWIVAHCTMSGSPLSGVSVSTSGVSPVTTGSDGLATLSNLTPGTYTVTATYQGTPKYNSGVVVSANVQADTYFDFTPVQPGTGSITVNAQDVTGKSISVTVTISGPATNSHSTPWTFSSLTYGTYMISATWKGETDTDSATISSSSPSASVTLHFSQAEGGTDVLGMIKALIKQYGTPITILGFLVTLLSFIVFVLPTRKRYERPSPSIPYYY